MMFKFRKLQPIKWFICFLFFFQSVSAGTLTPTEIAIQQSAKKEGDQALTLLEEVVNINSGTTNVQGVYEVGNRLRPLFEEMGFKTYWSDPPKGMNRAGTLFAERSGKKGKRILLISHLDTVFPKNSTFQHFTSEGRLAKGPGIIDAKGGDIVILYALKALASVKALDDVTIIVALVGDEEDSAKPTKFSRKALIDIGKKSDVALDFEPSMALESATIARRGISSFLIEAQGSDVHSSGIFSETAGFGAVFELTRILNTMQVELVWV